MQEHAHSNQTKEKTLRNKTKVILSIICWLFILVFPPIYASYSCRKAISFFQFEKAYESTKIVAEAGELIESLLAESSMEEEKKEQILLLFDLSNTLVGKIEDTNNKFTYKGIRNHIYANALLSLILEGFYLGWITLDFVKSKKKKIINTPDTYVLKEDSIT